MKTVKELEQEHWNAYVTWFAAVDAADAFATSRAVKAAKRFS